MTHPEPERGRNHDINRRAVTAALAAVVLATIALAAGCSDSATDAPEPPAPADVYTTGDVFLPFTTTIERGGTVRFHITRGSDDDGHNAIFSKAVPGAPADIPVVMDTVVSRTFATIGTFSFVCTVHPGMAGEVVVHDDR